MNIKTLIAILLLLSLSIAGYGQKNTTVPIDTIFLDKQKTLAKTKAEIAYYRIIYHVRDKYVFKLEDYYRNGRLESVGLCKTENYKDLWTIFNQLYRDDTTMYYNEIGEATHYTVHDKGKLIKTQSLKEEEPEPEEDFLKFKKYVFVEEMPEAPYNVYQFLGENLVYPQVPKELGIDGKIDVRFVVDTDGSITDIEVVGEYHHIDLAKAALLVISKLPKWKSGMQNGVPVKVYYTLPITFELGPKKKEKKKDK